MDWDKKKKCFCRHHTFAANGKAPIHVGGSVYPPEPHLRFAIVSYSLLRSYRFWSAIAAGAEAFHAGAQKKSLKKNRLKISPEPKKCNLRRVF
jgi:hypothetical protein